MSHPGSLGAVDQLRKQTIWSTETLFIIAPLVPLVGVVDSSQWNIAQLFLLIVMVIHCSLAGLIFYRLVGQRVGQREVDGRWFVALAVTTLLAVILATIAFVPPGVGIAEPTFSLLAAVLIACCAVTPALSLRNAIWLSIAGATLVCAGTGASYALRSPAGSQDIKTTLAVGLAPAFVMLVACVAMVYTVHITVEVLVLVSKQAQFDAVRADLAVAEERLRIARDLHDVFGRTLTAVALKSELAAALADVEQAPRAAEESRRIHSLADDALREVRVVLAEYRRPDFVSEVAGARALLEAAGVTLRVVGDPNDVPAWAREPLALVVREGATNIVRHSHSTRATLTVSGGENGAQLVLANNGALTSVEGVAGQGESGEPRASRSGLVSLAARLEQLGATMEVSAEGDTFTVSSIVRPTSRGETP